MTQVLKDAINMLSALDALSEEQQQTIATGVVEIVEAVITNHSRVANQPIWEVIGELGSRIPEEELHRLPEDGAAEHDHYIYGSEKQHP